MSAKTPYELRLEMLKLAQDQENAKFYNAWEQAARKADINENASYLTEVPEFPTTDQILTEAKKFKNFVDNG